MPAALIAALLLACVHADPQARAVAETAPWTRPEYVAVDLLHSDPAVARFRQDWYARTLFAMGEPSFIELARRPGQAVRFLWLRHWHAPIAVRVSRVGDQAVAELRVLTGLARPETTGRLRASRRVVLDAQAWAGVQTRLDAVDFWQAPTWDPTTDGGQEGARWLFEAIDDGRLHIVDRWSPDDPALIDLGLYLLSLAQVEIPQREVY
ncbi:MAG: hypothetical protein GXP62_10870 [Oligoflexia bacterium]|nr:hypothetical protein [Oligoflexia bacterium]